MMLESIEERLIGRIAMTDAEKRALWNFLFDLKPSLHVEIGTLWGGTAVLAALAGAEYVITIDSLEGVWWKRQADPCVPDVRLHPSQIIENIRSFNLGGKVTPLHLPSRPWPLGEDLQISTVLIDGDHRFEGCLGDWITACRVAQDFILMHDVDDKHEGVMRVVDEYVRTHSQWEEVLQVDSLLILRSK